MKLPLRKSKKPVYTQNGEIKAKQETLNNAAGTAPSYKISLTAPYWVKAIRKDGVISGKEHKQGKRKARYYFISGERYPLLKSALICIGSNLTFEKN